MILKGLLKTQLLVHSYSEGAVQKERKKKRKKGESLCDIYINLWLLTSEGRHSECWNVEQPLPNLNTSQVTAANAAAHAPFEALPEGNF